MSDIRDFWRWLTRCLWRGHRYRVERVQAWFDMEPLGYWTGQVCEVCRRTPDGLHYDERRG